MDFVTISQKVSKGTVIVYPEFRLGPSKDLMVRGKSFYAVWDNKKHLWSTDEYDLMRLVDEELQDAADKINNTGTPVKVNFMSNMNSKSWEQYRRYISLKPDDYHTLDNKVVFANDNVTRMTYATRHLDYALEPGDTSAYDEIISTLYNPTERQKIEWAIGSIISGDSKKIQKFYVFYGTAGTGKSTILNIIQELFQGYYTTFDSKAIGGRINAFATEAFKNNALVSIQHDGDLSHLEDNATLNSIISHEEILINEKFKPSYSMKLTTTIMMGTNSPVRISDAKSGIIRRLIDISPTGNKIPRSRYNELVKKVKFELGAIAYHCLNVYKELGNGYYDGYTPISMMYRTDPFFNFVKHNMDILSYEQGITLRSAYELYKQYCSESCITHVLPMYVFRDQLMDYYIEFRQRAYIDGVASYSVFRGFRFDKFEETLDSKKPEPEPESWLKLDKTESLFDGYFADCPAQYTNADGIPKHKWDNVKTKLGQLDTTKLHYVKTTSEPNHIFIDFDLKDKDGNKSKELNLEAASKWPPTYAEYSKGGEGIHLHYIYTGGDVTELDPIYADNIEIKVLTGNSALRRKLSFCNDIPIANINSGLPKRKKGDKVVNFENVKNEKMLRALIKKNLNKEIHAYTKPSIDFIEKLLSDAYASGFKYDVSDMRQAIQYFAQSSTNQAPACLKACMRMKYKSKHYENDVAGDYISLDATESKDDELVFYDIEVFPNLLVINWKVHGDDKPVNRMINPSPAEVEQFLKHKLVGFNCRRYDNHIVYARMMGYTNEQLFRLSQRIINGDKDAFFGEAYNLSYTDIYDFLSSGNKMSLKKWEIKLGIHHHELGLPWDKPVPEELWETVAEYCDDDVLATEALWNSKPCQADWEARVVLARIAGGTVNDTTNSLTTRLIFEGNKHPQNEFVYTDLSKEFPGYKFENGVSSYRDVEEVGEGGYVYSNPGIYHNVITFDVASMHPHSVIALNLFGDRYTQKFKELVEARIAVKHRDTETLKVIFNGAFAEFINASDSELKNLANALKTAINSVYGLTSAKFPNAFRDPRNIDNIVAKRGALFMINLRNEVEKRGGTVVHIKTDSIKIENPSPELQQFVMDYGKQYGYSFEIEHIFEKICLVNKAVYIAKLASDDPDHPGEWTATGTQFAVPYVFKTLFSKEDICFEDLCETKEVKGSMSIDLVEDLNGQEHNLKFVGKVGSFCPMLPGYGGGILVRDNNGKYDAVTGTKGYLWMESELVKNLDKQDGIDMSYYDKLVDDAFVTIAEYGDANKFINE